MRHRLFRAPPKVCKPELIITFIVPSLGRPTLIRTLESIQSQTNVLHHTIVVFDGEDAAQASPVKSYPNTTFLTSPKQGRAGLVRNFALPHVKTEWTGFVDDDDTLSPGYIDELLINTCDLLVFSTSAFHHGGEHIDPDRSIKNASDLRIGVIGIAYALKTTLWTSNPFTSLAKGEDIDVLLKVRNSGYKVIITKFIGYFINNYRIK